jgi:hypothetical protein
LCSKPDRLDRVAAFFAGTNTNDAINIRDPDFSVTDLAGCCCGLDGFNNTVNF